MKWVFNFIEIMKSKLPNEMAVEILQRYFKNKSYSYIEKFAKDVMVLAELYCVLEAEKEGSKQTHRS